LILPLAERQIAAYENALETSLEGPTMKTLNLQDVFLNQARKEKMTVTIYLTNGFQFKGVVKGFDSFTVILDIDGKQNLVYKHAISTIIPAKPINILGSEEAVEKDS